MGSCCIVLKGDFGLVGLVLCCCLYAYAVQDKWPRLSFCNSCTGLGFGSACICNKKCTSGSI
jgi:hypothetical protein